MHVLVLSETKLHSEITNSEIEKKLTNWNIVRRDDAIDDLKHMGLLLLVPKLSKIMNRMTGLRFQRVFRSQKIQIQGLILRFKANLNIGFVYCRSTPNEEETRLISIVSKPIKL